MEAIRCPVCKGKGIIHGEVDGTYPTLPCKCQGIVRYPDINVPSVWETGDDLSSVTTSTPGDWVITA